MCCKKTTHGAKIITYNFGPGQALGKNTTLGLSLLKFMIILKSLRQCVAPIRLAFSWDRGIILYMDATQQGPTKMTLYTLFGAWIEGNRDMLAVFAEYNDMVVFIQHESKKRTYKGGSLGYDSLVYIESELGKLCNNEEIEI